MKKVNLNIGDRIKIWANVTKSYMTGIVSAIFDLDATVYHCYHEAEQTSFRFTDKELDRVTVISEGSEWN